MRISLGLNSLPGSCVKGSKKLHYLQFFIAVLRLPARVGQESESSTDWAKTLKQHVAQRRALPTTIESFDEEALDEKTEVIFS